MVSDAGGFDDKSFNQIGAAGLDRAAAEIGVQEVKVESADGNAYGPNIDGLVAQNCDMIVTVGFLLADATKAAATANTETEFAIIDDNSIDLPNVKPLMFDTAQAAYLAGYTAAGYSTSGTVATFGGAPIPPVTIFMDGFVDGVAKYNEDNGADVKVLGWDKAAQNGSFTGDFENQSKGQDLAQGFIDQGADVIMPVAGPVGLGAATAAKAAGDVVIIGVDADWFETAPDYSDIILTSVLKNMDVAVFDAVGNASAGNFSNEPYVGTLANGGVALAPFHDVTVTPELESQVAALQEQIVAGDLTVESESSP
jgi:basic membrane protein A